MPNDCNMRTVRPRFHSSDVHGNVRNLRRTPLLQQFPATKGLDKRKPLTQRSIHSNTVLRGVSGIDGRRLAIAEKGLLECSADRVSSASDLDPKVTSYYLSQVTKFTEVEAYHRGKWRCCILLYFSSLLDSARRLAACRDIQKSLGASVQPSKKQRHVRGQSRDAPTFDSHQSVSQVNW